MVNMNELFQNAGADLHMGYKIGIAIVLIALAAWAGWSIIKFLGNLLGMTSKKEEQQNVEA